MVTPFYSDLAALSQPARLAYCFNPFAHVTSLIGGSFERPMLCDPLISAAEKLGVFYRFQTILSHKKVWHV